MTLLSNLIYNTCLILFILTQVIWISMIIYQVGQKRRILFSTLLTLSVNTIAEEETDYIFDSSSDDTDIILNNVIS